MILRQTMWLVVMSLFYANSYAAIEIYRNSDEFFDAIPGSALITTLDFDEVIFDNLVINSGDTHDGFRFDYSIDSGNVNMQVTNRFLTTSLPNSVGTDDGGDSFQGGDGFDISFASSNAIGMQFISADTLSDGDIELSVNGTIATLLSDQRVPIGGNSFAYFIGIIDTRDKFTSASISSGSTVSFFFNVDDVTRAVPSPAVLPLLLTAFIGGFFRRRRQQI